MPLYICTYIYYKLIDCAEHAYRGSSLLPSTPIHMLIQSSYITLQYYNIYNLYTAHATQNCAK